METLIKIMQSTAMFSGLIVVNLILIGVFVAFMPNIFHLRVL